jgi:hypothetical protein
LANSRLYENALSSLGAALAQWHATAQRIAAVSGPDPQNQSGGEVLRMIEAEEQLSAHPANADPVLMTQALDALAATSWPASPTEFQKAYETAIEQFRLHGRPIRLSPRTLYRYLNGRAASGFLQQLAKALRAAGRKAHARRLDTLIGDAATQRPDANWDRVIEFVRNPKVWPILLGQEVPLAPRRGMFVTFDLDTPTVRGSARWLHAALALWLPLDDCFLELRYPTTAGELLRFPTFADAGWFRHFVGARVGEPCGWTRPHKSIDPAPDRQPEAVHATPSLDRLSSPNDLRAVPP